MSSLTHCQGLGSSELPLKVVSGSMAMRWQGPVSVSMSVAHVITRDHDGDIPGLGSCLGSSGCPGVVQNWSCLSRVTVLWRAGPTSQHSGEQGPGPHWGSTGELALVSGPSVSQPECVSVEELAQPLESCSPWENGSLCLNWEAQRSWQWRRDIG